MSEWREQEATNQTIVREMNEWTEEARAVPTTFAIVVDRENPEIDLVLSENER